MKKFFALTALSLVLAGCAQDGKVSVTEDQLVNHRFVLESANGKPFTAGENQPEISFGEKMHLSGVMCNRFTGEGKLSNGALSAKKLAMTRMACADPQRNALDLIFGEMMTKGAQADLTETQLTLTTAEETLIFKQADQGR